MLLIKFNPDYLTIWKKKRAKQNFNFFFHRLLTKLLGDTFIAAFSQDPNPKHEDS